MAAQLLEVNINHIATLREVRKSSYPDPLQAVFVAEQAGAGSITVHLREDRRHIIDRDVQLIWQVLQALINLEIAATTEMLAIANALQPHSRCLVPEGRQEITIELGLDVAEQLTAITKRMRRPWPQLP